LKKAVFRSIMALALVVGLTLAMAAPVVADMAGGKDVTWSIADGHPSGVYLLGQTIYYELDIENLDDDFDAQADWVRDRFGADAVGGWREGAVEYWWNDEDDTWVVEDPVSPFAIAADSAWEQTFSYIIQTHHLIPHPTIPGAQAVVNQIRAEGTYYEFGDTFSVDDTTIVQVIQPSVELEKSVSPSAAQVGQTVTYTFTITNTGDWPLAITALVDDELGDLTGELPANLVLAPGAGEVVTYSYPIQAGDLPLTNTATVTAIAEGFDDETFGPEASPTAVVEDTASATVTTLHPVGGTASPVSRLMLFAPWIVLAGLVAGVAVFVWSRRAQSRA